MSRIKNIAAGIFVIAYTVLLIIFIKDVGAAVSASVKNCLEVIIPSLYAFMVISGFIVSSNLYCVLSRPFGLISRYIFRIPEEYFSIFIISSIGGYPVGARLLADMCRKNKLDKDTAEHMLDYCYLSGPAFICSIVGIRLFSSLKTGIVIFLSILSANLIYAFISGLGRKVPPPRKGKAKLELSFINLLRSVTDGAEAMLSVCAVIVFFSSFICILEKLNVIQYAARLISYLFGTSYADSISAVKSLLEISNIASFTANNYSSVPLIAALLSFGGVCVLMQNESFISGAFKTKRFYIARIAAAFLSYILCKAFMGIFGISAVYTSVSYGLGYRQNSPIPSLFLLIMTILLLLSNNPMVKKEKM
ncbi:MAG: hypothetical protein J6C96_07035 [Oscillospiraceae bacterium]|nr:hypothetical protein [Oscillospiraceae bacterium]